MAPRSTEPATTRRWSTNVVLVLSVFLLAMVFAPIWKPLLLGTVFASALSGLHDRWARRLWNRRYLSAALFTLAVALLILAPLTALAIEAVRQALDAIGWVRQSLERGGLQAMMRPLPDALENMLKPLVPKATGSLPAGSAEAGRWLAVQMQSVLGTLSQLAFDMAMMMLAFFFVLTDGHRLSSWIATVSPLGPARTQALFEDCRTVTKSVIGANFATGIAQAAVATGGYLLAHAPKPLFFGLVTLLASFIPSVGTAIVALPLAVLLYLSGHHGAAWFLAGWALLVVSIVDNLMRPLLIKGGAEIHGALIFFSLVGGMMLFGFTGLVIGPLSLTLFTALVRFHRRDANLTETTPATKPVDAAGG